MEDRATAVTTTNITMTPTYRPFERPPDPGALWTAIPRGLRGFVVIQGVLDAKPSPNQQLLTLSAALPNNFAYVFAEIHLTISQNRAGDWNDGYTLNLQGWYQGNPDSFATWNMPWTDGLVTPASGPPAVEKSSPAHSMDSLPKAPMFADTSLLISIQAQNQVATAALEGQVHAYINFWEFDLEQVRKYPVNSPTPVHGR